MNKIVCPKCGEEFELIDTDYLSIVDQVKTEEIAKEVNEKEKSLKIVMKADIEKQMANKELEIEKLNSITIKRYMKNFCEFFCVIEGCKIVVFTKTLL